MAFNVNEPRDDHGKWTPMGHSTKNVAKKVAASTKTHNRPLGNLVAEAHAKLAAGKIGANKPSNLRYMTNGVRHN